MREDTFRKEFLGLYCSAYSVEIKSRNMRTVGLVILIGKRSAYRVLVRKPGGNNRLGRPKLRWE